MYKEYREMSRTEAVDALYQDMAARHRARFRSIHVCFPLGQECPLPIGQLLINIYRFSRLSRLRSLPTSSVLTCNNFSRRTSSSPSLTVSPRPPPRRSSLPTGLPPSHRGTGCQCDLCLVSGNSHLPETDGRGLMIHSELKKHMWTS